MSSQPRISVIVTTHNRRPLLERAIESVMSQDERDFELIVVDDCSTDDTNDYLATLTDPRLRTIRTPRNVGIAAVRNLGLEAARADIVAMLDDDDVYLPGRLSVPLAVFAGNPDVVGTLSSAIRAKERQAAEAAANLPVLRVPDVTLPPAACEWALICFILGPEGSGITFRRKDAVEIGGFNGNLIWHEDREFMIRLCSSGACRLLGDTLWRKNWSSGALTTKLDVAGPALMRLCRAQPQYVTRHRKVGSYLATRTLIADAKWRLFGTLWRDWRGFKAAGLIDGNIARMLRDYRGVQRYRRRMLKPEALAGLAGPPETWQ